jgi:hypothetical protein
MRSQDDSNKVALHCDDVLEKLKTIDGHTSRNVLKKQQFLYRWWKTHTYN